MIIFGPDPKMDDSSKDTNHSAAGAVATGQPQRYSLRKIIISNALEALLDEFDKTDKEILAHLTKIYAISGRAYAAEKTLRRFQRRNRMDLQAIDLDNVTVLDKHIRLLDLQNECIKCDAEEHAEVRLVLAKLDKSTTLGAEIIANHNSEWEKLPTALREWYAERREVLEETRIGYIGAYRTILFENL